MADSEIYGAFGSKVAEIRGKSGLTQAELARQVGISRASLANIERGEQRVFLHQFLRLAEALGVSNLDDLAPQTTGRKAATLPVLTLSGDVMNDEQTDLILSIVGAISKTTKVKKPNAE